MRKKSMDKVKRTKRARSRRVKRTKRTKKTVRKNKRKFNKQSGGMEFVALGAAAAAIGFKDSQFRREARGPISSWDIWWNQLKSTLGYEPKYSAFQLEIIQQDRNYLSGVLGYDEDLVTEALNRLIRDAVGSKSPKYNPSNDQQHRISIIEEVLYDLLKEHIMSMPVDRRAAFLNQEIQYEKQMEKRARKTKKENSETQAAWFVLPSTRKAAAKKAGSAKKKAVGASYRVEKLREIFAELEKGEQLSGNKLSKLEVSESASSSSGRSSRSSRSRSSGSSSRSSDSGGKSTKAAKKATKKATKKAKRSGRKGTRQSWGSSSSTQ